MRVAVRFFSRAVKRGTSRVTRDATLEQGSEGSWSPFIGDPRLRERLPGVNLAYTGTAGTPGGSDEAVVTWNLIDSEARRD